MLKAMLEIIGIVIVISIAINIVTTRKVLAKATAFCETQVKIGKPSADLIDKSKQAGAKFYRSSADLNIYFTGSYRPAICRVSTANGVITGKQVETAD